MSSIGSVAGPSGPVPSQTAIVTGPGTAPPAAPPFQPRIPATDVSDLSPQAQFVLSGADQTSKPSDTFISAVSRPPSPDSQSILAAIYEINSPPPPEAPRSGSLDPIAQALAAQYGVPNSPSATDQAGSLVNTSF